MASLMTVPPTPTREQIEEFRREHVISAHLGDTAEAGLEPWAIEQNMVLRYLCSLALEATITRPEELSAKAVFCQKCEVKYRCPICDASPDKAGL